MCIIFFDVTIPSGGDKSGMETSKFLAYCHMLNKRGTSVLYMLLHQRHTSGHCIPFCFHDIDVQAVAKPGSIKGYRMDTRVPYLVHQSCNFLAEHIVYLDRYMLRLRHAEVNHRGRVEWIGEVLADTKLGWHERFPRLIVHGISFERGCCRRTRIPGIAILGRIVGKACMRYVVCTNTQIERP